MGTSQVARQEIRFRKLIFGIILLLVVVGLPLARFGPRAYSKWEQQRLLNKARTAMEAGDYARSLLTLRRVLELNPGRLEAVRMMADFARQTGRSEELSLRERVSLLAPDSFADALAFAMAALRLNDLARVRTALETMQRLGGNRGECHFILGRLAEAQQKLPEARREYREALTLAPGNEEIQYAAAALDLQARQPEIQEKARTVLVGFLQRPERRSETLRSLAVFESGRNQPLEALKLTRPLVQEGKATFADRLLHLSLLRQAQDPEYFSYLTTLQEEARTQAGPAAEYIAWTNRSRMPMLGREIASSLSPEMSGRPPVALVLAETYLLLKDWPRLQTLTAAPGANWSVYDHLRLAYLARAREEQEDTAEAEGHWKAAISSLAVNPERLQDLLRLASQWRWQARWEGLLWYMAETGKQPQASLQLLVQYYGRQRDTRNLNRALAGLVALMPNDPPLKNNWAMTSLLMRTDLEKATRAARELYEAEPTNASYASTYAYALYLTNKTDAALTVMRKLPPEKLKDPAVATYYGILLTAMNEPQAAEYLALAKSARLFPEEEQALSRAERLAAGGE